ncbi:MAG: AMP-binding protein [Planctomycetes bacterium]|nr:AMP-binding protein [Planctomycetota bacterium]
MSELPEPNFGLWFERVARTFAAREAIRRRNSKETAPMTYAELYQSVREAAAGFAWVGLHPGDRVGLIFDNRREWIISSLAITGQGAVDVPRGADTPNVEIVMILAHSGARGAVVDTPARAQAIAAACSDLPAFEFIVILDGAAGGAAGPAPATGRAPVRFIYFDELLEHGRDRLAHGVDDFARRAPEVKSDDLLTLVYTSGTTGAPKGVMLSHRNVLSNFYHIRARIPVSPGDVALSILPTWHMFERLVEYAVLDRGGILVYTDARRMRADLAGERPRLMATVPRIWETLHDAIRDSVAKLPPWKRRIFTLASRVTVAHLRARAKENILLSAALAPAAALASKLVFKPRLQQYGLLNFNVCVSGGGSLPLALDEFFLSIGIPILNGYGLTETSPVIAVRRLEANIAGTVGTPLDDTEIQLFDLDGNPARPGETGVLRVRGPQVTRGYYRDDEQTRKAFPVPGWFDTGDLARVDRNGNITIVGRVKDTIALRGGEKIEPERVETQLITSPFIVQAVLVGQDAKVVGAILVPNLEHLGAKIGKEAIDASGDWLRNDAANLIFRAEIDRLVSSASGFRPYERPVRFVILKKPIDLASGMLTQTLKLKRRVVAERFAAEIAAMLRDG